MRLRVTFVSTTFTSSLNRFKLANYGDDCLAGQVFSWFYYEMFITQSVCFCSLNCSKLFSATVKFGSGEEISEFLKFSLRVRGL